MISAYLKYFDLNNFFIINFESEVVQNLDQTLLNLSKFLKIDLSNLDYEISELKMYPNPSDGYINFNKSIDMVEIFDITGKKLIRFENIVTDQELNINKLDTGYYIIKIFNDNNIDNKTLIVR